MAFTSYTPITKLHPNKIKWTIRVRAQAVWKGIVRETKEFCGYNIIFVDDESSRIHAYVPARHANVVEKVMQERDIYEVSNFIVEKYSGLEFNRSTRYDHHIFFAEYTKVAKSSYNGPLTIPTCSVDLFRLCDLAKMESEKSYLCDVVGVVKDIDPVREYISENKETKFQKCFAITDGGITVKVTFFDDLAIKFEDAMSNNTETYPVVIISSCKIGTFQGDLSLTNYPATQFFLNVDHRAVTTLKERASKSSFYVAAEKQVPENRILAELHIDQIKSLLVEGKVVCRMKIKKIQEEFNWCFNVCTTCNLELDHVEGRYKCPNPTCGKSYTWPQKRFRICLICGDETGALPVILADREVRRLTGKTVFDLELDQTEVKEKKEFPKVFTEWLNTEHKFTVQISQDNVKHLSEIYDVCDIIMEVDQQAEQLTDPAEHSFEAEDSCRVNDMSTLTTQREVEGPKEVLRDPSKRIRKTTEKALKLCSQSSAMGEKNTVSIPKGKKITVSKAKAKTVSRGGCTNKTGISASQPKVDESDDEDITLSCLQGRKRKLGKQITSSKQT